MKKRILVVLALVLLLGGTTLAFGYWDNLTVNQTGETLVLGEGVELTVASGVHTDSGSLLVPSGFARSGQIDSYEIKYSVILDTNLSLGLTVTPSNIKIGGSTVNAGLVVITTTTGATTVNGTAADVIVIVTLTEPTTAAIYDAIAAGTGIITFDLTFVAA